MYIGAPEILLILVLVAVGIYIWNRRRSSDKSMKWTPASPSQVMNFVIFYLVAIAVLAFCDGFFGSAFTKSIDDMFTKGLPPLLIYSIVYSVVVRFLIRQRSNPAPKNTNAPSN